MTVIEASVSGFKDLADGTVRLSIDVEPRFAKEALELFRVRGTSIALAALKDGHGAVSDKPEAHSVGPLAHWLVMRCKEPQFWEWSNSTTHSGVFWHVRNEKDASDFVKEYLQIDSRKEIDGDPQKEALFHRLIRGPYSKWLAAKGLT